MICLVVVGCSCGRSEDKATQEKADSIANVSINEAKRMGVTAAATIAVSDTTDTLDMQRAIVDAYATRSQMMLEGKERAAKAFDKALKEELQRLNPALANEIFYEEK